MLTFLMDRLGRSRAMTGLATTCAFHGTGGITVRFFSAATVSLLFVQAFFFVFVFCKFVLSDTQMPDTQFRLTISTAAKLNERTILEDVVAVDPLCVSHLLGHRACLRHVVFLLRAIARCIVNLVPLS